MEDKVLKTDKKEDNKILNEKQWQRKTYPLKLKITDVNKVRIDNLIWEYKKAINSCINIIRECFYSHLTELSDYEDGNCPFCKSTKVKYVLKDFDVVKDEKDHVIPVYKKDNEIKICKNCRVSHYTLRKFVKPSGKRELPIPDWDFTVHGKLYSKKLVKGIGFRPNIYDSCLQKAVEAIKSDEEIKSKLKYKINFYRERIMENQVAIDNPYKKSSLDKFNELKIEDKDKISKDEYISIAIKILKKFIKSDEKTIENLKRRFSEKIEYRSNTIRLYKNTYSIMEEEEDFFIKLNDPSRDKDIVLGFFGEGYQKKLAKKFIDSKGSETEILRKNVGGDDIYYLQYIYRKEVQIPIPDETFTAVGIDVNIMNLACCVFVKKDLKPFKSIFDGGIKEYLKYSNGWVNVGRYMRARRLRFSRVRRKWGEKLKYREKGGKGRSQKWFKDKCDSQNEKNYVKRNIHNLTTGIIQYVKDSVEKPVIVLEDITDIRSKTDRTLKIAKATLDSYTGKQKNFIRNYRELTLELNKWNFADFQKYLEYKAKWLGIPVVYIDAKDTSIKCNKCGYVGKDLYTKIEVGNKKRRALKENENVLDWHQLKFRCKKCGYQANLDFNAGVNIARKFFENLKEKNKTNL